MEKPAGSTVVRAARRRGRPRKGDRPSGEPSTKETILRSAATMFSARGYDAATLNDIAGAAGLSAGSVYNHFRGKPELFVEVVKSTLAEITPRLASADEQTGPEWLGHFCRELLGPQRYAHRALVREVRYIAGRDEEIRDLFSQYHVRSVQLIASLVRSWQASGLAARHLDADLVAELYLGQVFGLCSVELVSPQAVVRDEWLDLAAAHSAAVLTLAPKRSYE